MVAVKNLFAYVDRFFLLGSGVLFAAVALFSV